MLEFLKGILICLFYLLKIYTHRVSAVAILSYRFLERYLATVGIDVEELHSNLVANQTVVDAVQAILICGCNGVYNGAL